MEDLKIRNQDLLDGKVVAELEKATFALAKPPFRPLDVFAIDNSSALELAGIVLTYVFVLLQFKVGDVSETGFRGEHA